MSPSMSKRHSIVCEIFPDAPDIKPLINSMASFFLGRPALFEAFMLLTLWDSDNEYEILPSIIVNGQLDAT